MSFLPGMFPAVAAAAKKLTTLTQVLSATDSGGAAFTLPVGIQAGDLIVVWDYAEGDTGTETPSGFTPIVSTTSGGFSIGLSYKIADGSEGGTSVSGLDGSLGEGKLVYVFRGDIPIAVVDALDAAQEISSAGNPGAQTVNASTGTPPLIVIAGYGTADGAPVDPRTFSPAKDGEINVTGGPTDIWLAYKIYDTGPADVTVDMGAEGDGNALASCYLVCA